METVSSFMEGNDQNPATVARGSYKGLTYRMLTNISFEQYRWA